MQKMTDEQLKEAVKVFKDSDHKFLVVQTRLDRAKIENRTVEEIEEWLDTEVDAAKRLLLKMVAHYKSLMVEKPRPS